jgi:hypothetical protein
LDSDECTNADDEPPFSLLSPLDISAAASFSLCASSSTFFYYAAAAGAVE